MQVHRATRTVGLVTAMALAIMPFAPPVMAQTRPTPRPSDSPATAPAPGKTTGMLEGSVKKVDPGAGTLQITSGPLGMFGRTLEVGADTQIQVQGRQGTLADLQEGSKIKASYDSRDGKNHATRIEVLPAAAQEKMSGTR